MRVSEFEAALRIPTKALAILLIVVGTALAALADIRRIANLRIQVLDLALLAFLGAVLIWVLDNWNGDVGRWFAPVPLVVLAWLTADWLHVPEIMTLMVIPTTLAAFLNSLAAAGAMVLGESTLLVVLSGSPEFGLTPRIMALSLAAMWAVFALLVIGNERIRQLSTRLEKYFDQAQDSLSEARGRKAELGQALDRVEQANRQLMLAGERMTALRAVAEEANSSKTMFLAKVSHEFRTPLNMIVGLVTAMIYEIEGGDEVVSAQFAEDLKIVQRNCAYLADLISDVLDLSRIDAKRFSLHRERVDLGDVIDSALTVVRPLLEKKRLQFNWTIPKGLPLVYCDRVRIRQVILNLMSNAARFTTQGGVSVKVKEENGRVRVAVTDTGPGIEPEDTSRIFEPFDQGISASWRDKGGSGLGLSISRQFVKLHGGRMWVESELGVGSRFFFELPVSPPIERIGPPGHWIRPDWVWREHAFHTAEAGSSDHGTQLRIVVCDCSGDLYSQLVGLAHDIEFVNATDTTQVLNALKECPAHLVLLNASGINDLWLTAEQIRQQTEGTPIFGCTMPHHLTRSLQSGASNYLIKPIMPADLDAALRALGKPIKRILVADDDPDVLKLFTRMLQLVDSGLQVITACSGEQALSLLRAQHPDLMLLDIFMPDLDGWQVMALKNQDDAIKDIPVIFVSAQDPAEQWATTPLLVAASAKGISLSQLLQCSLALSPLLMAPDAESDPVPG